MKTKLAYGILAAGLVAFTAAVPLDGQAAANPNYDLLERVDLTDPNGVVTSSKSVFVTGPQTAFNDSAALNSSANRLCIQDKAVDLIYDFETPTVVNSYGIYNYNDGQTDKKTLCPARAPRSWTFSGSNDGTSWIVLDEQLWESSWTKSQYRFYVTGNTAAYRYYKLDITANNGNEYTQFAKLEYYNVDTSPLSDFLTLGGVSVTSSEDLITASIDYTTPAYASVTNVVMMYGESADALTDSVSANYYLSKATATITGLKPLDVRYFKFLVAAQNGSSSETLESEVLSYGARSTATLTTAGPYLTPENWSSGTVPDQYYIDVVVDGDVEKTSMLTATERGFTATCGVLTITEGDTVKFSTTYSDGGTTLSWNCVAITNFGHFVTNEKKKNLTHFNFSAVRAPSYIASTGSIEFNNPGWQTGNSRMYLMLDGTVNDGLLSLVGEPKKQSYCSIEFKGGGVLTNNNIIRIAAKGGYASEAGSTSIALTGGNSTITGTGVIKLDYSERDMDGNQKVQMNGAGLSTTLCNDTDHTIVGGGSIGACKLLNKGLIKADSDRESLTLFAPFYGFFDSLRPGPQSAVNDVNGRIVATGPKGIRISLQRYSESKHKEASTLNGRFINKGLIEARTGSRIKFEPGINTESTSTSTSTAVGNFETIGLELGGRIAGGGRFENPRLVYIADGAKLMPGDLSNNDGTGESTCGTLSFTSNLVMRANAAAEFQCRKPEAGKYDSVWVNGDATVAGTLKFLENPSSGTYPLFTSTGTLTCDLKTLKVECAEGVKAPKLKLVESTYAVEQQKVVDDVPVVDEETGEPVMETVYLQCQRIEATWMNGFTIILR